MHEQGYLYGARFVGVGARCPNIARCDSRDGTQCAGLEAGSALNNVPGRAIPPYDEGLGALAFAARGGFANGPHVVGSQHGYTVEAADRPAVWRGDDHPCRAAPVHGGSLPDIRAVVVCADSPNIARREYGNAVEVVAETRNVGAVDVLPRGAVPVLYEGECRALFSKRANRPHVV